MLKRYFLFIIFTLSVTGSFADNWFTRFLGKLGETDTTYIEPQHYPGHADASEFVRLRPHQS